MRYSEGCQFLEESIDDAYSAGAGHQETRLAKQVRGPSTPTTRSRIASTAAPGIDNNVPDGDLADSTDDTCSYLTGVQFRVRGRGDG